MKSQRPNAYASQRVSFINFGYGTPLRAPGAATEEEITSKWNKVSLYAAKYSKMRKGKVAHTEYVEQSTVEKIKELDFVFVSIDDNKTKQWLFPALISEKVAFIDMGMGIERVDEKLLGVIRTSIPTQPVPSLHR